MNHIFTGECRTVMRDLIGQGVKVNCVVTSPPYWRLRDYGHDGQLGLEATPAEYVENMVDVFRHVRDLLHDDGTLWLNLGDCYATGAGKVGEHPGGGAQGARWRGDVDRVRDEKRGYRGDRNGHEEKHAYADGGYGVGPRTQPNRMPIDGLKPKDLVGIPWRVAFALQASGWYLRRDIIWQKPNPMPESVTDRPTTAHEYVFLLSKRERYFYDHEAIKEPQVEHERTRRLKEQEKGLDSVYKLRRDQPHGQHAPGATGCAKNATARQELALRGTRNKRSVWTIPTKPYSEAHFATFPEELVEPCVLAGTSARGHCPKCGAGWTRIMGEPQPTGGAGSGNLERKQRQDYGGLPGDHRHQEFGVPWQPSVPVTLDWEPGCKCGLDPVPGVVFDPFMGSGTTAQVARSLGRNYLGSELNPEYEPLHHGRTMQAGLALA